VAIRDDELAASIMGVNVYVQKIMVFVISSAITAYGGALYAFNILFIEPNLFNWLESGKLIIITFVGGLNSIAGVIAASAIYYSFGEFFRFIDVWRDVLLAVVVILVIIFRPGGLFQGLELLPRRLKAQRRVR
jgi:branched-chain amino acid transport system permease protein